MKRFECTVKQDAWQYWLITVKADNAQQASELAEKAWKYGAKFVANTVTDFAQSGVDGFDHAECEAEDCEEIDENSNPVHSAGSRNHRHTFRSIGT